MHPNPAFRKTVETASRDLVHARSFGMLVVPFDPVPLISHVPFLMDEAAGHIDLHLVRSNPIARQARSGPQAAKLVISGPDSYVSPDWYGVPDQVPTWNYVAVHLTGVLEMLPDAELCGILDRLSEHFETRLDPKMAWTSDKMSAGVMDKMMRSIVPLRFHIKSSDSTWKLGQNKPDVVRRSAAHHVAQHGIGESCAQLAEWMGAPPPEKGS